MVTEEIGTKSLQKNLEHSCYRSSIKTVTEELKKKVTEELKTQWLQKKLEQNLYRRT
jgi:hypothetical protein